MSEDWYERHGDEQDAATSEEGAAGVRGCCLLCADAEEGCLCTECKCRCCSHYSDSLGRCNLAVEFSESAAEAFEAGKVFRRVRFESVLAETPKARLVQFDAVTKRWVPKSVVQGDRIQQWFLEQYRLRAFIIPWRQAKLGEEETAP